MKWNRVAPTRLLELVNGFSKVPVLVLADLVLDEFRFGDISRVSREAPVLILNHRRTDSLPGGGANGIHNLKALGALPVPIGRLGDDSSGNTLLKMFKRMEIPVGRIWTHDDYQTPTKTRILAGSSTSVQQQVVRIDEGEPRVLSAGEEPLLLKHLEDSSRQAKGLLISDYAYGLLHPGNVKTILGMAKQAGLPVIVDSRSQLSIFQGITAAVPNLEEAEAATGIDVGRDPRRLEEVGKRLLDLTRAEAIMITLGSRGLVLFLKDQPPEHLPVFGADEVADVTGAGDTVAATFTLARLAGGTYLEAAALANVAGGLVVMKRGTATVSTGELTRAVSTLPTPSREPTRD